MDTDSYLAMEFLKMRLIASGELDSRPEAATKVFDSKAFEDTQRKAWKDAIKFRAIRDSMDQQGWNRGPTRTEASHQEAKEVAQEAASDPQDLEKGGEKDGGS